MADNNNFGMIKTEQEELDEIEYDIIMNEDDDDEARDEEEEYLIEEEIFDESQNNENYDQNNHQAAECSEDENTDLYHCNVCDVHFASVSDHINQFHTEQIVILEVEDSQSDPQIINEPNEVKKIKTELITAENGENQEIDEENERKVNIVLKESTQSRSKKEKEVEPTERICPICKTIFSSQKSFKLHLRMHNPIKNKTIEETVESEFNAYQNDQNKEVFFCKICNKNYDLVFKDIHMQTHSGKTNYICTTCNKKFSNEELLVMHLNIHQEKTVTHVQTTTKKLTNSYPCSHCGKVFGRPHEKVKHERVHTGEKPHKCEICGKCFRVSYCLTLHMRTHTDLRPYVCTVCNKRFKAQSVYNHHLLTHSDARPYQCPYCPKTFKTSVQLSGHKNSHTKPFSCPECNRPFATLYAVKNHMESHKRPNHNLKHVCSICGAVYARGFALKDHIKECHIDVQDQESNQMILNDNIGQETFIESKNIKTENFETILLDGDVRNVEMYSEIDQFATEEVITDWLK